MEEHETSEKSCLILRGGRPPGGRLLNLGHRLGFHQSTVDDIGPEAGRQRVCRERQVSVDQLQRTNIETQPGLLPTRVKRCLYGTGWASRLDAAPGPCYYSPARTLHLDRGRAGEVKKGRMKERRPVTAVARRGGLR
jgi:hypothetical protein